MPDLYKNSRYDRPNRYYADVDYHLKELAKPLGAHYNPSLTCWYFDTRRARHDWDMQYSQYISDEAKEIDEYIKYNDIIYTICQELNDKDKRLGSCGIYSDYKDYVMYLLNKYGPVPYDYFNESYDNVNSAKNSRTKDGLEIHHIDEDQYLYLSSPKWCQYQRVPMECQKANRLVYCNKLEHLILHLRILEDYHSHEIETYYKFGIKTLISKINDYFEYTDDNLPNDWTKNMILAIKDKFDVYLLLLIYIAESWVSIYNMNKDKAKDYIVSSYTGQTCNKVSNELYRILNILDKQYSIEPKYINNIFD